MKSITIITDEAGQPVFISQRGWMMRVETSEGMVTILADEVDDFEEYPHIQSAILKGHAFIHANGDISVGTVFCGMSHVPASSAGTFDQKYVQSAAMHFCSIHMEPYGLCHVAAAENHIKEYGSIPLEMWKYIKT